MVKFYEGSYLFKLGYPFLVITSQEMKDGKYETEVFILVQQVPSQKYTVESYRFPGITFRKGIENPEALLAEEALHWAQLHLDGNQQDALDNAGIRMALPACQVREKGWELELLRMRLRGLSDETIADIIDKTVSTALAARLTEVLNESPIIAREVKI